ncbi:uncharacterized membrane protein YgaE (UPF0421/DUF939 family) [Gordonia amarae]|uniref:Integral membrane bound transporter domain-containing protein n=1 Tax=Gordonia amarae NBRC 15530 TaxID=1075090 RepID=G7GKN1_9ACTN|nr:uncharacterized membrane protein YgaE (UPF0421/DUF939 family) [Gordonia amarae]GAB04156.1 hypothetical protein GOAMR_13_00120 [Gordonia amarae NBRC 15530]
MSGKQPALSVRTRVRRRIRRRIDALPKPLSLRVRRLWLSAVPITQCAVAAGLAWWIAVVLLDHDRPFFAPIAAVVSLGLSLAKRWRRSVELVSGVTVGILAGDLVISWIGSGTWQIMVVIAIAMSIAVFLDEGPLLPMQAASSAALVATLLPPGDSAGIERAVDALIGGVVGILVVALMPVNPALRSTRDAAGVLGTIRDAATDLAAGLRAQDVDTVSDVLARARGTQGAINTMRADMAGGREISTISPLYWSSRQRLQRIAATADPIDNSVRNFRVVARRALAMTQAGEQLRPEIIEIIGDLSGAYEILREMMLAPPGGEPDEADAARVLRTIARKARTDLVTDSPMSETAILAQLRSLIVDLLMVAGLRRSSARATLRD